MGLIQGCQSRSSQSGQPSIEDMAAKLKPLRREDGVFCVSSQAEETVFVDVSPVRMDGSTVPKSGFTVESGGQFCSRLIKIDWDTTTTAIMVNVRDDSEDTYGNTYVTFYLFDGEPILRFKR